MQKTGNFDNKKDFDQQNSDQLKQVKKRKKKNKRRTNYFKLKNSNHKMYKIDLLSQNSKSVTMQQNRKRRNKRTISFELVIFVCVHVHFSFLNDKKRKTS